MPLSWIQLADCDQLRKQHLLLSAKSNGNFLPPNLVGRVLSPNSFRMPPLEEDDCTFLHTLQNWEFGAGTPQISPPRDTKSTFGARPSHHQVRITECPVSQGLPGRCSAFFEPQLSYKPATA